MLKHFQYDHLPKKTRKAVSMPLFELAQKMEEKLPDGPEKREGMRKLLEAKDCFVRSFLEKE